MSSHTVADDTPTPADATGDPPATEERADAQTDDKATEATDEDDEEKEGNEEGKEDKGSKGSKGNKGDKEKKKKKLEFTARVFARTSIVQLGDADYVAQSTLPSARAGFDYRSHELRVQLEVEVADKAKVKDAYAQLRLSEAPKIDVRAGNFKMPFSAIQGESIWTLPMADRGLVDNVLVKRLQVAGRAIGAMVSLDLGGPHHVTLRAGGFQARDDAGEPLAGTADHAFAHDAVVRVSVRPVHGVELGASGSVRSGALIEVPLDVERAYAAEADVTVDIAAGPGRVRAWVEGMIGTSWLVGDVPNHERTRFLEARTILAYRVGNEGKRARYIEPYVLGAVVDPDRIVDDDHIRELAGGITYGSKDRWRLQLEAEAYRFGVNAPLGIAELAVAPVDSLAFLVQLGARI